MADDDLPLSLTVAGVFKDYLARRNGIVKALTTDIDEFCRQCDPEAENLCLYGLPDGTWKVSLPEEEVPAELPEPALGVNFARDGMIRRDWLALLALHSNSWLMAVAFFLGARFDRKERNRLFQMINNLPTIIEVVDGARVKSLRDGASVNGPSSRTNPKLQRKRLQKLRRTSIAEISSDEADSKEDSSSDAFLDEDWPGEDDDDEQENSICGLCGGSYAASEFWIFCDSCKKWFHGKCVKVTPARAEHIKIFKCPPCTHKRPRPQVLVERAN